MIAESAILSVPKFHRNPSFFFGGKAFVDVRKEGKWYVATDLVTHVADQGRTREEAIGNLTKGLREHYALLLELGPKRRGSQVVEVEV